MLKLLGEILLAAVVASVIGVAVGLLLTGIIRWFRRGYSSYD